MNQLPLLSTRTTPSTRGACEEAERPCPHKACRYHLWAEDERPGRPWHGQRPSPIVRVHSEHTCALDVADAQGQRDKHGKLPLEAIGEMLGITAERVRQLEMRALEKLKALGVDLEGDGDVEQQPEAKSRVRLRVLSDAQMKLF